jgi:hypothetical protein
MDFNISPTAPSRLGGDTVPVQLVAQARDSAASVVLLGVALAAGIGIAINCVAASRQSAADFKLE